MIPPYSILRAPLLHHEGQDHGLVCITVDGDMGMAEFVNRIYTPWLS